MKKFCLGLATAVATIVTAPPLQAGTIFFGAYPNTVVVFDEAKGAPTQTLPLSTGLPRGLQLSNDNKRIYVLTISTAGIEVIDAASKKVVNKVSLNSGMTRYRINAGVPDSTGRYYYLIGQRFDRLNDRYKVGKRQYMTIDMQAKKIVRAVDLDEEDARQSRMRLLLSPDDKTLYVLGEKIRAVNTADFKVSERIDLAKPGVEEWADLNFGGELETQRSPNEYITLLNASDSLIKNKVFGIGRLNLSTRQIDFKPIGPAPDAMLGLQITPDGKEGYTVVTTGTLGNKRCEFWHFDLASNKVLETREFECRSRLRFGMSANGEKLYIHGASFDIAVYDAKSMKLEKVWNMGNDATGAGIIAVE